MRLAVVSDIHGNLPALQAVAAEIAHAGVDAVWNLGDIASGPLWPAETCAWLMSPQASGWHTIRGNHERQVLAARSGMGASDAYAADRLGEAARRWLARLPATAPFADGRGLACHGTPTSDLRYLLETVTPDFGRDGSRGVRRASASEVAERVEDPGGPVDARTDVVLCGHSHQPRVLQARGCLLVNPGSLGLPAFDDTHPHYQCIETGSPHARWAVVERTAAGWQAQLRCTASDWTAAARQAERAGRGDWADALAPGFVGRTEAEILH